MPAALSSQPGDVKSCNACGAALLTSVEKRIGVHIWCVANQENRFRKIRIPGPNYDHTSRQSDS
jgi:hypothetical protein